MFQSMDIIYTHTRNIDIIYTYKFCSPTVDTVTSAVLQGGRAAAPGSDY